MNDLTLETPETRTSEVADRPVRPRAFSRSHAPAWECIRGGVQMGRSRYTVTRSHAGAWEPEDVLVNVHVIVIVTVTEIEFGNRC